MISSTHVDDLARRLVELGGSDLHLKAGVPPAVRERGLLTSLEGYEALRSEDTEGILQEIIPNNLVGEFEGDGEADFSYAVPEIGRFRVNAFKQRGSVSVVLLPGGVPRRRPCHVTVCTNPDQIRPQGKQNMPTWHI